MQYEAYDMRGINIRTHYLLRDKNFATDILNLYKNKNGYFIKRPGTQTVDTAFGGNGLKKYYAENELIGVESTLKKLDTGAWTQITNPSNLTLDTNYKYSFANIRSNLYFGNNNEEILKYDGVSFYKAGMPYAYGTNITTINASAATSPDTYYYYIQFATYDRNGIYVEGRPSTEDVKTVSADDGATITLTFIGPKYSYADITAASKWLQNTAYVLNDIVYAPDNKFYIFISVAGATSSTGGTALDDFVKDKADWFELTEDMSGFNTKYARVNGAQSETNTITVDSGHTLEVGDSVYIEPTGAYYVALRAAATFGRPEPVFNFYRKVTAIGATSITVDGDAFGTNYPDNFILSSVFALIYQRTTSSETFLMAQIPIDPTLDFQTTTFLNNATALGVLPTYAQTRGLPTKARDLVQFQNLLFAISDDYELSYSSADSHENFPTDDNKLSFNDQEKGVLTALAKVDDYLFIFTEYEVYFGTGTFGNNQGLRIWSSNGDNIGCVAKKSVQVIDKAVVFLADDGIFIITGGAKPVELSAEINQIITENKMPDGTSLNLQLTQAESVKDDKRNHYICYIPDSTPSKSIYLVYDYFYKDWFIWQGYRADGGMEIVSDVLYSQGKDTSKTLVKRNDALFADSGTIFKAMYSTDWFDLEAPGVDKKFVRPKIYSFSDKAFTLTVKNQLNWRASDEYETTLAFDGNIKSKNVGIDKNKGQSCRIVIENELDEQIVLSGIEFKTDNTFYDMKK